MDKEKSINMNFYLVSQKQIVFIPQCYDTEAIYFLKHNIGHEIIHKISLGSHLSILSDI